MKFLDLPTSNLSYFFWNLNNDIFSTWGAAFFSFFLFQNIREIYLEDGRHLELSRREGSAADVYVAWFDGAILKIVFWAHTWRALHNYFFLIVEMLNEWQPTQNISEYFILILLNG